VPPLSSAGPLSGTYVWLNGEMKTDYYFPFDTVWAAVEKTVADMKATDVMPEKEIAQGKITALINDEKVTFSLKYKSKNQTTVSVRVGAIGNKLSSQLIHDKIADNLRRK
jgi:DNA-binding ferritin-like protein (Dps family)